MDTQLLFNGLIQFVAFIILVTFHEFAHAWTADKCGDDTPRHQGRLTLDPLSHIDWLGTILLPLILVVAGAMSGRLLLFGWGRPVEVNLHNFRHRRRDDILVSAAGPAMNLLLAVVILGLTKMVVLGGYAPARDVGLELARLSLFLCFFNLLPIPPLDGGHIVRNLIGLSDETYAMISRWSILIFLVVMQSKAVQMFLATSTNAVLALLAMPFGWNLRPIA